MKFSEMEYVKPDIAAVCAGYAETAAQLAAADTDAAFLAAMRAFWQAQDTVSTAATLASVRHTQNVNDAFYEEQSDFFDENAPVLDNAEQGVYRAALASPHLGALREQYGDVLVQKMQLAIESANADILDLMAKENALTTRYQKLYASAQIPFDGKLNTVSQMGLYKQNPSREVRRAAYEAEGKWWDEHQEELDEIYDALVKNRTEQAQKMGYKTFTPLGAIRMQRIGYTAADMAAFRTLVAAEVTPVAAACKQDQAKRIGVDALKFYDDIFAFKSGNALPHGTPDEILAAGKEMYTKLSPETASFIKMMFDGELFDVLSREGKAPGGYCTDIAAYKVPFIFSNFNGTSADVDVLTHEAGHAFAATLAVNQPPLCRWPGMESCEIHSMSMEFLTAPYHHLFFSEDTAKYEYAHAADALYFLPYGTMVDDFQTQVYEHPDMTPAQRNELWLGLEKKYRPWVDFDGLPFYGRGAGWQRQLHIYQSPFYYIDYCMAQVVALQFFAAARKDAQNAWQRYMALAKKAGTATYGQLVESAGFASPFAKGTLAAVANDTYAWLKENEVQA